MTTKDYMQMAKNGVSIESIHEMHKAREKTHNEYIGCSLCLQENTEQTVEFNRGAFPEVK